MQDTETGAGTQPQAEDSAHFLLVTIREGRRELRIQVTIRGVGGAPAVAVGAQSWPHVSLGEEGWCPGWARLAQRMHSREGFQAEETL